MRVPHSVMHLACIRKGCLCGCHHPTTPQGTFISWDPTRAPGYRNISKHEFRLGAGARTALPGHDPILPVLSNAASPAEGPVGQCNLRSGQSFASLSALEQPFTAFDELQRRSLAMTVCTHISEQEQPLSPSSCFT